MKTHKLIPCAEHPSNLDPSAHLVSPSRERFSVFRVNSGFVAVVDGLAFECIFETEQQATSAAALETAERALKELPLEYSDAHNGHVEFMTMARCQNAIRDLKSQANGEKA